MPTSKSLTFFAGIDYNGWILLEASTEPVDKIAAMKEQLLIFK